MAVFRVSMNEVIGENRKFINLETKHSGMEDVYNHLKAHGVIYGHQLFTRKTNEHGLLEVIDSREVVLGAQAIFKIETPGVRFVKYEPER